MNPFGRLDALDRRLDNDEHGLNALGIAEAEMINARLHVQNDYFVPLG